MLHMRHIFSEFKLMFWLEFDVRQDKVVLSSFNRCNHLWAFNDGNYIHMTKCKHYYFLREIQHRKNAINQMNDKCSSS
jgi:hypothetical protein